MNGLRDALDHPIPFVFFLGLALLGMYGGVKFLFKSVGWSGPAALVE